MFSLRSEHMAAFADPGRQAFTERVEEHVRTHFPDQAGRLGKALVRRGVRAAIARATLFGLDDERGIVRFVSLTFLFGLGFEEKLKWAVRALASRDEASPAERLEALFEAGLARADQGEGIRPPIPEVT